MKHMKKVLAAAVIAAMCLAGCRAPGQVPVQKLSDLRAVGSGAQAERFAGMVVSENAVEIKKEADKSVKELYVKTGDRVAKNDRLFSYDSDELSLSLDKLKLDMDRLDAGIGDKKGQISEVEKELKNASGNAETQLNIQLRQLKTELTQSEYDRTAKQKEVDYAKKMLENVDVLSPIDGTVRKIDESGNGPYLTIQQTGAYKVKGTLNEMSLGSGIMEGVPVTVISRLDPEQTWTGTVSEVDYSAGQSMGNQGMGGMVGGMGNVDSGMSTATGYPFYVTLESTEGLLLGQHVYLQIAAADMEITALTIPEAYTFDMQVSEETGAVTAKVWVAGEDRKLTAAAVSLGDFIPAADGYVVLDGLTEESLVADPQNPSCAEGAPVSLRSPADFPGNDAMNETTQPAGTGETSPESGTEVSRPSSDEDVLEIPAANGGETAPADQSGSQNVGTGD